MGGNIRPWLSDQGLSDEMGSEQKANIRQGMLRMMDPAGDDGWGNELNPTLKT